MTFELGAASELYRQRRHPRLYLGSADLPQLRRAVGRGLAGKMMRALRQQMLPLAERILGLGDIEAEIDLHWYGSGATPFNRQAMGRLQDLAFVGIVDQNAKALEATARVLRLTAEVVPNRNDDVLTFRDNPLKFLARAYDLIHDYLTPAERAAFCHYAYRNGIAERFVDGSRQALTYYHRAGQNMHIASLVNCLLAMLAIDGDPGVPDLAGHWQRLLRLLEASLNVQFNRNGYPEEDIGYGTLMAAWLAQVVEPLRRAGIFDAHLRCPQYLRFGDAILHFVQPWGNALSNTGDHGDDFSDREFILARLAAVNQAPELIWLLRAIVTYPPRPQPEEVRVGRDHFVPASMYAVLMADQLGQGCHPRRRRTPTHFCEPKRGIVSFRSGWGAADTLVIFDGSHHSPAGAWGHNHAAGGHFSISAFGEYFSIDTGRFNMEQSCHSVVLIDGKSGRTAAGEWSGWELHTGLLTACRPGPFVDAAAVDSTAQHNCTWARRHLGLVKGDHAPPYVWVVDDIGREMHWGRAVFWWQLQTSPGNRIRTFKRHARIVGCRQGNLMDVHFALPPAAEYPRPHRLLDVFADEATLSATNYIADPAAAAAGCREPREMVHGAVYVRPRLVARIEGDIGRFMSVMLPRRQGEPAPRVSQIPSLPASLALRIAFAEVEDTVIFAYEHQVLEAADIKGGGRWCVVRRDRSDGRVLRHAVGDGSWLEVSGRQLAI